MSKEITLKSLNLSSDEFKELESTFNRSDLSKKLGVSKSTLTKICKELNISPSRIFREWNPKYSKEEILKARELPTGENYKSLEITSHEYRKHLSFYKIPKKKNKTFKEGSNPKKKEKRIKVPKKIKSISLECLKMSREEFKEIFLNNDYKTLSIMLGFGESKIRSLSKKLGIKKKKENIFNEDHLSKKSNSMKKYYENEKEEERELRIEKSIFSRRKSALGFKNLSKYCLENNITPLFSEEDWYKSFNKEVKYSCNTCQNIIRVFRSTGPSASNPNCDRCNPIIRKKGKGQRQVYEYILSLGEESQNNNRRVIDGMEIDIYLPIRKIGIEYNGLRYHSEGYSLEGEKLPDTPKNYHLIKTEKCEEEGIQLLHIFENEWYYKRSREIWKSIIKSKLNLNNRIFARKCRIKEVSNEESRRFLEENHLQGSINSKIRIGLYLGEELIQMINISKHPKYQYELKRLTTKKGINVVGGASRLLKHFEREYLPSQLMSFADRRHSIGNSYSKLGFKEIKKTTPNYFYFKGMNLESRWKYQKSLLKDKLDIFDEGLSEFQNMKMNGYRRIFDSGNILYLKRYN